MDDIDVCNAREEPHRALCNGPHHEIVAGCSITGIFAEANERVMAASRLDQEADAVRLHKGRNCTLCIALVADERIAQLLGLSARDIRARLNDQKVALHRCDRNVEICHLRDLAGPDTGRQHDLLRQNVALVGLDLTDGARFIKAKARHRREPEQLAAHLFDMLAERKRKKHGV